MSPGRVPGLTRVYAPHPVSVTVRSVELVDKPAISINGTFARDGESVLRLVTCGGEFDRSAHSYYSNVVVTAVPA